MKRLLHHRFTRFVGVGLFNTGLDFVILNTLIAISGAQASQTIKLAGLNAVSVSFVACISFFLNRRIVFRRSSDETPGHRIIVFVAITLSGLFLINETLFTLILHHDTGLANLAIDIFESLHLPTLTVDFFRTNIAKAIATCGSLVWNYKLYKKFVFNDTTRPSAKAKI